MYKKLLIIVLLFTLSLINSPMSLAKHLSCNSKQSVKGLDAKYENALKVSDVDFLEHLLSQNYIWVHNHGRFVDTKDTLVGRAKDASSSATGNPRSRTQRDVKVLNIDKTWVVSGFTEVDRGESPITYAFMRTYVQNNKGCKLLAAQTMALE